MSAVSDVVEVCHHRSQVRGHLRLPFGDAGTSSVAGGNWRWVEGWIFGIWYAALFGSCLAWLYFKDPALLAERFRKPGSGGQSRSDLIILIG